VGKGFLQAREDANWTRVVSEERKEVSEFVTLLGGKSPKTY
jgi:hypothetical protein